MRREVDILFDGTYEGFLCVIYAYYYEGILPLTIGASDEFQPSIMQEEFYIVTDQERAAKVQKAIHDKISGYASHRIGFAFLSSAGDRYMALLHYIVFGFKVGRAVDDHMQQDCVLRVHKLAREVSRESHLLKGFCRFAETEQGIYYCAITPIHHVLELLAIHFADRMMNQSWVIHDKRFNKAAIYDGNDYILVEVAPGTKAPIFAGNEEQIQNLWAMYFNTMAIDARRNPKLHRNMLPLRFRGNMVEFQKM